jgi:hypothetical protein
VLHRSSEDLPYAFNLKVSILHAMTLRGPDGKATKGTDGVIEDLSIFCARMHWQYNSYPLSRVTRIGINIAR